MKQEENDRKHLTPRQIVNRFRKGEYVNEGMEAISSAVSSCGKSFDSVAVPFPTTIVDLVLQNVNIAKALYERQKEGRSADDIFIPDHLQLKDILAALSYPPLWEAMQTGDDDAAFRELQERDMMFKFSVDGVDGGGSRLYVVMPLCEAYKADIEQAGLSFCLFELVLCMMAK